MENYRDQPSDWHRGSCSFSQMARTVQHFDCGKQALVSSHGEIPQEHWHRYAVWGDVGVPEEPEECSGAEDGSRLGEWRTGLPCTGELRYTGRRSSRPVSSASEG